MRTRWLGDPGFRDAPEAEKAAYDGLPKPFCPCDTGNPQDCKPEEWAGAHSPRPPCRRCGLPIHAHQGNYCRRPTPWAPRRDNDWIWDALTTEPPPPWVHKAIEIVNQALEAYAAIPDVRREHRPKGI